MKLNEAAVEFIAAYSLGRSESTMLVVKRSIAGFVALIGDVAEIDDITLDEMEDVFQSDDWTCSKLLGTKSKPLGKGTLKQKRAFVRKMFEYCVKKGHTTNLPFAGKELEKAQRVV